MVFKVYYQETLQEVPVRERTKSLFVEADTEEDVRKHLKDRPYNIEYVTDLSEDAQKYEELNENYRLENV